MPRVGDVLGGKYKLVELIGKGGMGQVFKAQHESIGRVVAIKCLFRENAQNGEAIARFFREARTAASIGHPSIIGVHDIGEDDEGIPYLIMDYLDGENLRQHLERVQEVEIPLATYVVAQALSALAACHDKGIIHRDIKPDNIFLVDEAQALPGIRLLDFGISKVKRPEVPGEDKLTRTGAVVGTVPYMSPEQIDAKPDVDNLTDLYAMGVVLYESVTGHLPFDAKGLSGLIGQICFDPYPSPRERRSDVPVELEALILRAMSRDRSERYPHAQEMLNDLLPFLDDSGSSRVSIPGGVVQPSKSEQREKRISRSSSTPHPVDVSAPTDFGAIVEPSSVEVLDPGQSGESEPSEYRPPTRLALVLGAIGFMAAATVAVLLLVSLSPSRSEEEARSLLPTVRAEVQDDAGSHDRGPARPITITLEHLPSEARVLYDGAEVSGSVLHLERSSVMRELRVELIGHEPWRRMVTAEQNQSFEVDFVRIAAPDAGATKAKRPRSGRVKRTKGAAPEKRRKLPDFRTGFPVSSDVTDTPTEVDPP